MSPFQHHLTPKPPYHPSTLNHFQHLNRRVQLHQRHHGITETPSRRHAAIRSNSTDESNRSRPQSYRHNVYVFSPLTYLLLQSLRRPIAERIIAMFTALRQLGYHPCHGTNMWEDPSTYLTLWTEAMRAKYMGQGEPWGRRELDVVLGKFDVCIYLPPPSPPSKPFLLTFHNLLPNLASSVEESAYAIGNDRPSWTCPEPAWSPNSSPPTPPPNSSSPPAPSPPGSLP